MITFLPINKNWKTRNNIVFINFFMVNVFKNPILNNKVIVN